MPMKKNSWIHCMDHIALAAGFAGPCIDGLRQYDLGGDFVSSCYSAGGPYKCLKLFFSVFVMNCI